MNIYVHMLYIYVAYGINRLDLDTDAGINTHHMENNSLCIFSQANTI